MSVYDLLTPLPKNWANLNVNSINIGTGGLSGGPFHITETVATGPSSITGDVGTFDPQLTFATTNQGASYVCVGPEVTSGDSTARVKLYAANAPETTSGLFIDGNCKIATFQPATYIALLPNNTSVFAATEDGVSMPIQRYLEVQLPAGIGTVDNTSTPITTMTSVRSVGANPITYNPGTGVFTIPSTGVYTISYSATWQGGFVGSAQAYIAIIGNGSLFANSLCGVTNAASNTSSMTRYMPGATQFTIQVSQSSGGGLNLVEGHVIVYQNS